MSVNEELEDDGSNTLETEETELEVEETEGGSRGDARWMIESRRAEGNGRDEGDEEGANEVPETERAEMEADGPPFRERLRWIGMGMGCDGHTTLGCDWDCAWIGVGVWRGGGAAAA